MAHESPLIKSSPIINACASPSGEGCILYLRFMPKLLPSPRRRSKLPMSAGVDIIRISRIPASIRVESG